jgi:hypothetical protein
LRNANADPAQMIVDPEPAAGTHGRRIASGVDFNR